MTAVLVLSLQFLFCYFCSYFHHCSSCLIHNCSYCVITAVLILSLHFLSYILLQLLSYHCSFCLIFNCNSCPITTVLVLLLQILSSYCSSCCVIQLVLVASLQFLSDHCSFCCITAVLVLSLQFSFVSFFWASCVLSLSFRQIVCCVFLSFLRVCRMEGEGGGKVVCWVFCLK